jgi:hypothetical protein
VSGTSSVVALPKRLSEKLSYFSKPRDLTTVIPAKAESKVRAVVWIPAFAGMTVKVLEKHKKLINKHGWKAFRFVLSIG